MPNVPSPLATATLDDPRAGEIGPVRREIIFEPLHEQPAPAEPTPAAPEREPEAPAEPVPD
jgi:hypothetical protein